MEDHARRAKKQKDREEENNKLQQVPVVTSQALYVDMLEQQPRPRLAELAGRRDWRASS